MYGGAYLGVHVELLAHKSIDLGIGMSTPRHSTNVLSTQHVARADAIPAILASLDLVRSMLVLLEWRTRVKGSRCSTWCIAAWASGVHIILPASILVIHAALMLCCRHQPSIVDPIIAAKVVEPDVIHRVEALLGNQLHDAVATPADGVVLELHDSSRAESLIVSEVARKARHRGNHHDHLVFLASASSTQDALHDGGADLVLHRALRITCCRDEELVLDVHKMLTVLNHSSVCIRDRVFQTTSIAPFGTAAHDLA